MCCSGKLDRYIKIDCTSFSLSLEIKPAKEKKLPIHTRYERGGKQRMRASVVLDTRDLVSLNLDQKSK